LNFTGTQMFAVSKGKRPAAKGGLVSDPEKKTLKKCYVAHEEKGNAHFGKNLFGPACLDL